jgi:hypothetical protein
MCTFRAEEISKKDRGCCTIHLMFNVKSVAINSTGNTVQHVQTERHAALFEGKSTENKL